MDGENNLQKMKRKNGKTVKIKVKLPHVNKKITIEKAKFLYKHRFLTLVLE